MKPIESLREEPHVARYLDDPIYRTKLGLYTGLAMNILYIFIKLVTGILYRSEWLIVFALYYVVLTGLRVSLASYVRRHEPKEALAAEYHRSRLVGVLLVPMTIVLSIILARMIGHNEAHSYPGFLIYGMAAYVFYAVILAAVNVFRFRRLYSPILSAVKVVNLTAALVALLSLEAAMLTQFGGEGLFRSRMLGISGLAVCGLILGMASAMIIRATKNLNPEGPNHE